MPVAPVVIVIAYETELGRVIRDVLIDEGHDVTRVRCPYGAIGMMREKHVDLIVSLPSLQAGGSGPMSDLLSEFPDVALIALPENAAAPIPVIGRWRREGNHITLRQPFQLNDLIAAARDLVG